MFAGFLPAQKTQFVESIDKTKLELDRIWELDIQAPIKKSKSKTCLWVFYAGHGVTINSDLFAVTDVADLSKRYFPVEDYLENFATT